MVTPAQRIQVSSTLCCGGRQYALLVVSHLSNLKSGVNVNTAPRNVEGDIGRCIQRNRNWQLTLLYVSTVGKNFRPLVMTENFVAFEKFVSQLINKEKIDSIPGWIAELIEDEIFRRRGLRIIHQDKESRK